MERRVRLFRLPEDKQQREIKERVAVPIRPVGDYQTCDAVYTEDGFQAWSSPIFVYRKDR